MSRYSKVKTLPLAPGHCFACRNSSSPDGFVDLGFSDEWMGAFYLCEPCITEMGRLFGMKASFEVGAQVEALALAKETVSRQEVELIKLHAVRVAIQAYREGGPNVEPGVDLSGDPAGGKRRGRPRRTAEPEDDATADSSGAAAE